MRCAVAAKLALALLLASMGLVSAEENFDDLARRAASLVQQDPKKAAALYEQALKLRPEWAEGWFYLGASRYQMKQYPDAREAFLKATSLAPSNGSAWAFLGLSEYELQEYAPALAHISKAESLPLPENQAFVSTFRVRGAIIEMRAADFTAAIDQLRPLAAAGDDSPPVIEALGVSALTLPVIPGQIPEEKRALVDLAGRAVFALYAQRAAAARKLFAQLAAEYPREPGVHYVCGLDLLERHPEQALQEFRRELQISPTHVLARVQIAVLEIKDGDPKAALTPAREAVKLAPSNFLCHLALGRALLDTDQTQAAIPEFESAVKLAPAYPFPHFYLAQAYRRAGRDAQARHEYAEFSRLKSNRTSASDDNRLNPEP